MILARYTEFRRFFAAPGAPLANDGLPAFPGPVLANGSIDNTGAGSLLRANSFSGTLRVTTAGGHTFTGAGLIGPLLNLAQLSVGDPVWPLDITCNADLEDSIYLTHEYDWYVAARRDPGRYPDAAGAALVEWNAPPFLLSMPDPGASGRIYLALNTSAVAALFPGLSGPQLLTASAWTTLFRHTWAYVRRRSDGSYQAASLYEAPGA